MPQCEQYPKGCSGKVMIDPEDNEWFCENHYYKFDRMKNKFIVVGGLKKYLKTSAKDAPARRAERVADKGRQ